MTKLLDEITARLAEATLAVGEGCANYAALMESVLDETTTAEELVEAEAAAWRAHQAIAGLSLRNEAMVEHVRTLLLTANVPGWVNHGGHIFYDVDSLPSAALLH